MTEIRCKKGDAAKNSRRFAWQQEIKMPRFSIAPQHLWEGFDESVFRICVGFALIASPAFAAGYKVPQVSDQAGVAPVQDTDLVNPWGLAQVSDGAPEWTSDNGTNKSTFYDRNTGVKQAPVARGYRPGASPIPVFRRTSRRSTCGY